MASDEIAIALNELLQYRKSRDLDTAGFKDLKHNADLCPMLENQLGYLLDCYLRYHRVAYDVQGLRDRGTDVVLRLGTDEDKQYVSFQVKSYSDLQDEGYLTKLGSQILQVQNEFPTSLEHCYVLVCTDVVAERDKVRFIKKDLGNLPWVTVVDPAYAWTFLRLSPIRIESLVQAVVRRDDLVYSAATKIVEQHSPMEIAAILVMLWLTRLSGSTQLDIDKLRDVGFFQTALARIPDYDRDDYLYGGAERKDRSQDEDQRVAELIEWLEGGSLTVDTYTGALHFEADAFRPFEALMLDAMVRYEYEGDELLELMFETLGVPAQYDIPFEDAGA